MSESDQGPALRVIDLAAERIAKRRVKRSQRPDITKESLKAALRDARAGKTYTRPDPACGGLEIRVFGVTEHREGYVEWSLRLRVRGEFKITGSDDPMGASKVAKVQRRYAIGDHTLMPEKARHIAHRLKDCAKQGENPARLLVQLKTGVSIERQIKQEESAPKVSVPWKTARMEFLAHVEKHRSISTYDTYRKVLENTPELAAFDNLTVAAITPELVSQVLAQIGARAVPTAEGTKRTLSSMWTWLSDASRRERTGVPHGRMRGVTVPERPNPVLVDPNEDDYSNVPPATRLQLGRVVAIAKSGALGQPSSDALLVLLATAQRRRTTVGLHRGYCQRFGDEVLWKIPPYFRKPSKKKRSRGRHLVPLVGWAAEAERRLDIRTGDDGWYFQNRKRRVNKRTGVAARAHQAKTPHANQAWFTHMLSDLDAGFPPQAIRSALATYGPADLGWAPNDAKLILDHLEGFDPGDVTAQFYNMDPAILRKRKMMVDWLSFLDACEAEAVKADPTLTDRETQGRAIYLRRNGEEALLRMLKSRARRKDGKMPWSDPDQ